MATKKKGLGRGLDVLLGGNSAAPQRGGRDAGDATAHNAGTAESAQPVKDDKTAPHQLPIELIRRGKYQPRRDMHPEALEELAASIKAQGLMQPIVVRPVGMGQYEIIAGERRWRASQQAGLDEIPVVIKDVNDDAALAMALIENIQREDLNAMEEAMALQRLQTEFELTHQQIADAVGKSRAMVSNLLRLTQLPEEVRTLLERGDLEMGHARALLSLEYAQQAEAARKVVSQGLTVRQTEALVRQVLKPKPAKATNEAKSKDTIRLEQELGEKVGLPVSIQHKPNGKGSISFSYASLDELEGLLERL